MLFRKKMPRSCSTCQHSANFSENQYLCAKRGVVEISFSCRKYKYDPCKRIPLTVKVPDFSRFRDEDFQLD